MRSTVGLERLSAGFHIIGAPFVKPTRPRQRRRLSVPSEGSRPIARCRPADRTRDDDTPPRGREYRTCSHESTEGRRKREPKSTPGISTSNPPPPPRPPPELPPPPPDENRCPRWRRCRTDRLAAMTAWTRRPATRGCEPAGAPPRPSTIRLWTGALPKRRPLSLLRKRRRTGIRANIPWSACHRERQRSASRIFPKPIDSEAGARGRAAPIYCASTRDTRLDGRRGYATGTRIPARMGEQVRMPTMMREDLAMIPNYRYRPCRRPRITAARRIVAAP